MNGSTPSQKHGLLKLLKLRAIKLMPLYIMQLINGGFNKHTYGLVYPQ